jgi:riboflavin-specific deaminase-like protein
MAPEATPTATSAVKQEKPAMSSSAQAIARRWWHRGNANHGWLRSFFTFSFANYYDPSFESFSNLRVINEDRVAPMTGFPTHAHSNAEIFSYIVSGELTHKDSMGNIETLKRGEVQFTSAGSGIRHSEYNNHPSGECHFLQIWYTPNQRNLPPKYYTVPQVPDVEKTDKFMTLIKDYQTFSKDELKLTGLLPKGRAIPAHCSLSTGVSILTPGKKISHILGSETTQKEGERWAYLHLAMTSGYKNPEAFDARIRKDMAGYSKHEDRLVRAARFSTRVYGNETNIKVAALVDQSKPRVTLTYAQSKDGKIAGPGKKMVALSGQESMIMTHSLRTIHEGILVGVGTLLNDDPQLNARLLNPLQGGKDVAVDLLPRPIILDSKLRTPVSCKILTNAKAGKGKAPLIIAAKGHDATKAEELRLAGAEIIEIESQGGLLPWNAVFDSVSKAGIKSVMVEGGATVIESLFAEHEKSAVIDELIVTVAPVTLGEQGLGYTRPNWLSKSLNLPPTSKAAASNELQPVNLEPEIFNKDFVRAWSKHPVCNEARIKVMGQTLEEGDGIFIKKGKVGDEIVVENCGTKNAEVVLFDLTADNEGSL